VIAALVPIASAQQGPPSISQCKDLRESESKQELEEFRQCLKNFRKAKEAYRRQEAARKRYEGSVSVVQGGGGPPATATPGAESSMQGER
jgi:hypothetical protein